mmetsp:Transcript_81819/g.162401  ORF Transcript_81819/g.162401 Transcript_81819/m.162401 type:complete len:228 (+) Transcript_81819:546-1229(+)
MAGPISLTGDTLLMSRMTLADMRMACFMLMEAMAVVSCESMSVMAVFALRRRATACLDLTIDRASCSTLPMFPFCACRVIVFLSLPSSSSTFLISLSRPFISSFSWNCHSLALSLASAAEYSGNLSCCVTAFLGELRAVLLSPLMLLIIPCMPCTHPDQSSPLLPGTRTGGAVTVFPAARRAGDGWGGANVDRASALRCDQDHCECKSGGSVSGAMLQIDSVQFSSS